MESDYVENVLHEWARARPDLDTAPFAVIGRIYRLSMVFERRLGRVIKSCGLSRGTFDILAALRRAGPPHRLTPTELYNALLVTSGAITHRLNQLEDAGFVERKVSSNDRRVTFVFLTRHGKRRVDDVATEVFKHEHSILAPISQQQQHDLAELLRILLVEHESTPR